jgi:3',5'-nucleoside bisphosphate phosphatase
MNAAEDALRGLLASGPVDLHLHSTASDGTRRPADVVEEAVSLGLRAFSLTDHDTLDGLPEAERAARHATRHLPGVRFLPGIELSIQEECELHLLGYFPLGGQEALEPYLDRERERRRTRNVAMVEALNALGLPLSQEELDAEGEGVIGRLHAARVLLRKGAVGSLHEAFDKYLATGRPGYVERERPDAEAGCAVIRAAGGVPVLAHPVLYGWLDDRTGGLSATLVHRLSELKEKGLGGVESHHGEALARQVATISAAARKVGLIATRGSDFHGETIHPARTGMYSASVGRAWPEGTPKRAVLRVAAAVVRRTGEDGRTEVLLARRSGDRSLEGFWEFPGGKVAASETMEAGLVRELREELDVASEPGDRLFVTEHAYEDRTVRLSCYDTKLARLGGFTLAAHSEVRWVPVDELDQWPLCPADYPVADRLARRFGR